MNRHASDTGPVAGIRGRRFFLVTLAVTLLARIVLAAGLPLSGDEAYFLVWGQEPAWGYYDHPPMVGWWLALLVPLSEHPLVLRLPALLVPLALAWGVIVAVRRHAPERAWLAGTLLLLAPINAWNVAITTDVPLMFFSGLAVLAYLRALRTGSMGDFALCGLALGGALMSKYFAGLLAIAIFVHSIWRPDRTKLQGLALIVLCSLPAAAIQIAWNAAHCWPNVMFNIVNRHDHAGLSWETPLLYAASVFYVLSPPLALALVRRGARRAGRDTSGPDAAGAGLAERAVAARASAWLVVVPLVLLGALSLGRAVGLHWLASFVLPAVLWFVLAGAGSARARAGAVRFGAAFAALHYLVAGVLLALPVETWSGWRQYPGLVMTVHGDELARAVRARGLGDQVLASHGYSPAVLLEYAFGQHVLVFGAGSSHARHDDMRTDFSALDGRDFLIVRKNRYVPGEYDAFFDRVTTETLDLHGARFTLVTGHGFRYAQYRDDILDEVRRRWYALPTWLPAGSCYFCDRYFPDRPCRQPDR